MSGILVVLEGIEACGKTTQVRRLKDALSTMGFDVITTREPGGTVIGEHIRDIFINSFDELTPETEVALLLAAKRELQEKVIKPALARGAIVLCDRSDATLLAYQGGGKGIDAGFIRSMLTTMNANIPKDLTCYLRLTPEQSFDRLQARKEAGEQNNAIDEKGEEFHRNVFNAFEEQFAAPDPQVTIIPANNTQEVVTDMLLHEIVFLACKREIPRLANK